MQCCRLTQAAGLGRGCAFRALARRGALHARGRDRQDQDAGSRPPGPIVILVEPQLGENIGAAARAMANFGLSRLRLVKPRDGWPNPRA